MTANDTLKSFLEAWKDMDYEKMYNLCQKTWMLNHSKSDIKKTLSKRIKSYSILKKEKVTDCVFDISVKVKISGKFKTITARLIREEEPFKPSQKGEWGVNPISLTNNLY